jgi:hypothetical protein
MNTAGFIIFWLLGVVHATSQVRRAGCN